MNKMFQNIRIYALLILFVSLFAVPVQAADALRVQFFTNDASVTNSGIKLQFNIFNDGTTSIPFEEITLRYWYTDEAYAANELDIFYAVMGDEHITHAFHRVEPSVEGADTYLELGFLPSAGNLAPGAESGRMTMAITHVVNAPFDESDDWSWNDTLADFADWDRVTAYRNDELLWGFPPGGGLVAYIVAPALPAPNEVVTFNGDTSVDLTGNITQYDWEFSDGTIDSGAMVQKSFAAEGTYTATLTIANDLGQTATTAETVRVITSLSGPFWQEWQPKTAPAPLETNNPLPDLTTAAAVNITINPDTVLRRIPQTIMGNNTAVWNGDSFFQSDTMTERLNTVNMPLLRYPGGSTSESYHWDGNYPAYAVAQGWDSRANEGNTHPDEFVLRGRELGYIPLITVNHGYASYDTTETNGNVDNAAELAANWVEYMNAPNDGSNPRGGVDYAAQRAADGYDEPLRVQYWEVGNEVYGAWTVGNKKDNGAAYAANYNVIADAMREADPTIYIGIVGGINAYEEWFVDVISYPGTAERVDYIDIHNYFFFASQNPIDEPDVVDLVEQIGQSRAFITQAIAENTDRDPAEIPLYMGEYNATNRHNPHNVSLVSGLFVAEAIGEMMVHDYAAASIWDIINGWHPDAGGTHGFLTQRHTGIPDLQPYPTYYPFFFYTRNFGDRLIAAETDDTAKVSAYASTFDSGEVGIVIINEHEDARQATIDLGSFVANGAVNGWVLSAPGGLEDTQITLNGVASGYDYAGPIVEDVPAYHWTVTAASELVIDLAGASATSLLVYGEGDVQTVTDTPVPEATATPTPTPSIPLGVGLDTAGTAPSSSILLLSVALLLTFSLIVWRRIG